MKSEKNLANSVSRTMPACVSTCEEWAIFVPGAGTVLALAEHATPCVATSVLYEDLASTIDTIGGLLKCSENGGQMPVKVNKTNSV
jgi:hypothetical protein